MGDGLEVMGQIMDPHGRKIESIVTKVHVPYTIGRGQE